MKTSLVHFVFPVLTVLCVASCADSLDSRGPGPGVNTAYSQYGTGVVTYSTLPTNYTGSAYYYGGRYYTGGRYETGTYRYQGRTYASRYSHGGRYYYGGAHNYYTAGSIADSRRPYAASAAYGPSMTIGSVLNTSPIVDTSTSRNADIYSTSATRGPVLSFASPWITRRTYAAGTVTGR